MHNCSPAFGVARRESRNVCDYLQIAAAAQSQTGALLGAPSCAEMQTLTALFIVALASLVAGFGAFTEDPANANKHIPGCISVQEHVPKEPTAWSSHPS